MACSSSKAFCSIRSCMILLPSEPPPPPGPLLALLARLPLPVPLPRASFVGAHSLLTRQPNSSGPSWSPGMFTTRKRMSGWKVLRLRWTSYTVTLSHRYSPGSISLVISCERTMVSSLPFALPAHHEPLAAIEFVKGGAHCGDPALVAQVQFHAYSVT